jgi:hypothetical protein
VNVSFWESFISMKKIHLKNMSEFWGGQGVWSLVPAPLGKVAQAEQLLWGVSRGDVWRTCGASRNPFLPAWVTLSPVSLSSCPGQTSWFLTHSRHLPAHQTSVLPPRPWGPRPRSPWEAAGPVEVLVASRVHITKALSLLRKLHLPPSHSASRTVPASVFRWGWALPSVYMLQCCHMNVSLYSMILQCLSPTLAAMGGQRLCLYYLFSLVVLNIHPRVSPSANTEWMNEILGGN